MVLSAFLARPLYALCSMPFARAIRDLKSKIQNRMNPIILFIFLLDAKCHIVVTDVAPDTKINIAGNCNIFFVPIDNFFSAITFIFDPSQGGGFSF